MVLFATIFSYSPPLWFRMFFCVACSVFVCQLIACESIDYSTVGKSVPIQCFSCADSSTLSKRCVAVSVLANRHGRTLLLKSSSNSAALRLHHELAYCPKLMWQEESTQMFRGPATTYQQLLGYQRQRRTSRS
jgi:hypothetical protein